MPLFAAVLLLIAGGFHQLHRFFEPSTPLTFSLWHLSRLSTDGPAQEVFPPAPSVKHNHSLNMGGPGGQSNGDEYNPPSARTDMDCSIPPVHAHCGAPDWLQISDDLTRAASRHFLHACSGGRHGRVLPSFSCCLSSFGSPGSIYMKRKGWLKLGFFHLAAALIFSALHTTMMAISRHFLAPLMGPRSVRLRHHDLPLPPWSFPTTSLGLPSS